MAWYYDSSWEGHVRKSLPGRKNAAAKENLIADMVPGSTVVSVNFIAT